ncbi:hypothetical protein FBU30_010909 [Linnemannia zychae]|nr:hypothetical protein FBU30_010909 [Linnemannia zychae]
MTTQPLLHLNLATQQHGASAPCTTTSPISPTTPSVYPSLQQRRASLLQQQQQRTSPTLSLSSAPTAELTSATSPPPLSISNSNFNKNSLPDSSVPLARTPSLPLTPQEYQGLVASGALPVRQALQTHIATSGEKPPETKEEARAALEAMFQIRADKIRRSIEQGKLATAEALQHKVIKRRESIVDVTQKTSSNEQHYHRDRSLSAPMERVTFAAAFNTIASPQQPQRQSFSGTAGQWFSPHNHISDSATIASSMASQEPVSMYDHSSMPTEGVAGHMLPGTGGIATITGMHRDNQGESMVVDSEGQHTTFGLSDDDLMCSFTHFTAKLSDSLLARDFSRYGNITAQGENASIVGPSHPPAGYNSYSSNLNTRQDSSSRTAAGQEPAQESMLVDTALPNLSPTASNESQSSSPWIPWHRTMTVEGGEQNTIAGTLHGATGAPMAIHPFAQSHSVPQPSVISVPASTTASLLPIHSQQIQVPITLAAPQLQQQGCPVMYTKDPRDQGSNFQQYNPSYSSSVGFDVHPLQMHPQEGFGAGGSQGGGSCVGEKQTEAWNQYVQYLLHQQELAYDQANPLIPQQQQHQQPHPHVQQGSFNHQQESGAGASYINTVNPQVMDPHWQATMMTMMMDQNPKNEAVQGLGQQTGYCISTSSGTNLSL